MNCPIADAMETEGIVMATRAITIAITTDIGTVIAVKMFGFDRLRQGPSTWNGCRRSIRGCKRSRAT